MTLLPTLLAPLLVILVAVGGLLIFHFTEPKSVQRSSGTGSANRGRDATSGLSSPKGEISEF